MGNGMNLLLGAFITLMLGIILLSVYADNSNAITSLTSATETLNLAPARLTGGALNTTYDFTLTGTGVGTWKSEYSECLASTLVVKNVSGTEVTSGNYTYTAATGKVRLTNTLPLNASSSNTSTVTYSKCPDGYTAQAWGRSMQKITVGLFAVMCLAASVGFVYAALKEMGIKA